jgi:hypothetical protein
MVAVQGGDDVDWNFADLTDAILAYSQIKPSDLNGSATLSNTGVPESGCQHQRPLSREAACVM